MPLGTWRTMEVACGTRGPVLGRMSRLMSVRADRPGSTRSEITLEVLRVELAGDTRMVRMMGELLTEPVRLAALGELLTEPVVLVSMADRRAMQRT